jgi:hypothetical protein
MPSKNIKISNNTQNKTPKNSDLSNSKNNYGEAVNSSKKKKSLNNVLNLIKELELVYNLSEPFNKAEKNKIKKLLSNINLD